MINSRMALPSGSGAPLSRRRFVQAGCGAASAAWLAPGFGGERAPRRPNVLYVFSDMQRAGSMACYGDPNVRTPALDAFAAQGARLDAAMSNTPVCCPHRASLMTGLYSHHHGVVSNNVRFIRKARGFAEQFRDAGYVTGYAGKWHIPAGYGSEDSMPLGFPADQAGERAAGRAASRPHYRTVTVRDPQSGRMVEKEIYAPSLQTDRAIRFIEEKSKGPAPWLFVLSWVPPHTPYAAPPEFRRHYDGDLRLPPNVPPGPPAEFARKALPDYYGMVESLDAEFSRLLDALKRAGVAGDTIVVYSSDHGDMVGCHGYKAKRWPHEESARVPFLIRYPRAIPAGRVLCQPFSTVDVYPTLAALAGLKPPPEIDGLDYSPLLTGQDAKAPRGYAFLQMMYAYVPWPGWRALRTGEYSYARTAAGPWLLFDMRKDPCQMKNLVDDRGSRAVVEEMDRRLAAVMKESGDSWEHRAQTGDIASWMPGGPKQRSQNLGVPWPGAQWRGMTETGSVGGRKARRGRGKKTRG